MFAESFASGSDGSGCREAFANIHIDRLDILW
jgi:hypothetical protein